MVIEVMCPNCGKRFKIDVPSIDKYKARVAYLEKQLAAATKSKAPPYGTSDNPMAGVDYLKNIFGMFDDKEKH